jgi:molybdopterin-dependent oxidoreductase alpha subunit
MAEPVESPVVRLAPPVKGEPVPGRDEIAGLVPFGIGENKPHHFVEMGEALWENRDSLRYAWNILSQGVCDGCSLGPRGMRDDVTDDVHVCTLRLKHLRNHTRPTLAPADLLDIERLRTLSNHALQELGRLPYPFLYRPGDRGFTRTSWDNALELAGRAVRETPPQRQGWFAGGKGLTNESYYAFTKAARLCGTNHVDLSARLRHAATVTGLESSLGVGAPTCSLSDLIGTDLLLLIGANLAENQPVAINYLVEAKRRGTRIVVISPTVELGLQRAWVPSDTRSALLGSKLMDDFISVSVGGDAAFLNGVLKALDEKGALDLEWINRCTVGFEALRAKVQGQSWEALEASSGARRSDMDWVAELYSRAKTMVTVYGTGLTQHRFGVENVEAIVNLHLARGMLGREKTGIMPIHGHSGVQGGLECGVSPDVFPGGRPVDEASAAEMERLWGHPVPSWKGHSAVPMMLAAEAGEIDLLYNMGGNLLTAMPSPQRVTDAFGKIRMRVHQDIVINTSMLVDPAELLILLPAQTRYEQRDGGTSTSTERRVRFSPEIKGHPKVGEARADWDIPGQVAAAAFPQLSDALSWPRGEDLRREMGRVIPLYRGIETLRKAGDWIQWGGARLFVDDTFPAMPDGKAAFKAHDLPDNSVPDGSYTLSPRRGSQREDIWMNPADLVAVGVRDGQRVRLRSEHGEWVATARAGQVHAGVIQACWPECNHLIGMRRDPRSEGPDTTTTVTIGPA